MSTMGPMIGRGSTRPWKKII